MASYKFLSNGFQVSNRGRLPSVGKFPSTKWGSTSFFSQGYMGKITMNEIATCYKNSVKRCIPLLSLFSDFYITIKCVQCDIAKQFTPMLAVKVPELVRFWHKKFTRTSQPITAQLFFQEEP